MAVVNATPFPALDAVFVDELGRDVATVIVKATFVIDEGGNATPAGDPAPVRVADELHRPEETWSSAKYPSDVCWAKVGTDVIVVGEAVSAKPARSVDVTVSVGERAVPLRVHGDRLFYKGAAGIMIGSAAPFERKAIVWERAYGGVTADCAAMENRNPSGVGVARRPGELDGKPAPQIEHPAHPHTSANDKHAPVGVGSILSFWSPRRELAGTFDARWQAETMPLFPGDFDLRFNNVASPALVFEKGIAAGERVSVAGMSLAPMSFALPRLSVVVRARFDKAGHAAVEPAIDTVLVEPGSRRVEITGRATFPVGRGRDALREMRIDLADL